MSTPTVEKTDIKHLTEAIKAKRVDLDRLVGQIKDEDGKFVVSRAEQKAFVEGSRDLQKMVDTLTGAKALMSIDEFLAGAATQSAAASEAANRTAPASRSLSAKFLGTDQYAEMKAGEFRQVRGTSFKHAGSIRDVRPETKDVYTALGGTQTLNNFGTSVDLGIIDRTLRPGRVRDLFPSESTTASSLYALRATGFVNNAASVPERRAANGTSPATGLDTDVFARKPKSKVTYTPYKTDVITIAHIMYAHRNVLADEPRLRSLLDRDLVDGIKMAEDEQLLYGAGGEDLLGIMNQPGIQVYTGLDGSAAVINPRDRKSMQVRRAITRALLAYYQPTGIVLNPLDWEDMELETDADNRHTLAVSVALGGEQRLWRLNVVDTTAMNEGEYLVGAFGSGAKVYDREDVTVEVSTENGDLFERNAITLRCEERLALVVERPESMVKGSFHAVNQTA